MEDLRKRVVWVRANELFDNPVIFSEDINADDINQTNIGSCYLLASLSALTEFPHLIKNLFGDDSQVTNDKGVYTVFFYIGGRRTPIMIDDWIPTLDGQPLSTVTSENELWAILVEKAWAKLHGSYQRMEGGLPSNALFMLTGKPSWRHIHSYTADLWSKILHAEKSGFIMVCGTEGQGESEIENSGIAAGHAYSLLAAHEFMHRGTQVRLVKLRNPWGSHEWNGAWSDSDDVNWTPELRKKYGCNAEDDGIFFMSILDYTRFFNLTAVCSVHSPDETTS